MLVWPHMSQKKGKIFVGLSGGVDSSVSAALLKRDGHDVVGVFIKVWQADFLPCTWREERREAMRVAAHLNIPFVTLDLEKEYKQGVVDYMIGEYSAGRIPNPDVMCNKHVKFGAFLDFALAHGASHVATGHYARVGKSEDSSQYELLSGVDPEKDQSYFLWTLTERELARTLFPVGEMKKTEVRALAKEFGLPNAEKKDSQGLCFMGKVDMKEFLQHYLKTQTGEVLDTEGNVIGTHDGAILYTIGQRHGFRTRKQTPDATPLYVIGKDIDRNTITVSQSPKDTRQTGETIRVREQNDLIGSDHRTWKGEINARIRHRGAFFPVIRTGVDTFRIIDAEYPGEDIAMGQSVVFYQNDQVLGGGIITE